MYLTVEIINDGAINLLNDLESLGLVRVKPAVSQGTKKTVTDEQYASFLKLRGIHAGIPGASVENFLAECREDKKRELAIEKREEEERESRSAVAKVSS